MVKKDTIVCQCGKTVNFQYFKEHYIEWDYLYTDFKEMNQVTNQHIKDSCNIQKWK